MSLKVSMYPSSCWNVPPSYLKLPGGWSSDGPGAPLLRIPPGLCLKTRKCGIPSWEEHIIMQLCDGGSGSGLSLGWGRAEGRGPETGLDGRVRVRGHAEDRCTDFTSTAQWGWMTWMVSGMKVHLGHYWAMLRCDPGLACAWGTQKCDWSTASLESPDCPDNRIKVSCPGSTACSQLCVVSSW